MKKDTSKCAKCKGSLAEGSIFVEGGKEYHFCKLCSIILKDLPTNSISHFVSKKGEELINDPILKNILHARLRRNRGISLWK